MALTIISTNTVVAGTAATLAGAGDDLHLLRDVLLASTAGTGIQVSAADTSTRIDGTLVAQSVAYYSPQDDSRLIIGETGVVSSFMSASSSAAIRIQAANSDVINHGEVSALEVIGVLLLGPNAEVQNTGLITGTTGVQFHLFGLGDRLINTGTILGSGSFDGVMDIYEGRGVLFQSLNGYLYNGATGVIGSTAPGGTGIAADGPANGLIIENFGHVTAAQGHGIDVSTMSSGSFGVRLNNFGTISGFENSFIGSVNIDTVMNRGTMSGYVEMGTGSDRLDTRFGTITQTVTMDDGEDRLITRGGHVMADVYMGSDNDVVDNRGGWIEGSVFLDNGDDVVDNRNGTIEGTIYGGVGNDRLIASAGEADIFDGGTGVDIVDYRHGTAAVVALDGSFDSAGAAINDAFVGVEVIYGSRTGADHLRGSQAANQLRGEGGADTLDGAGGADVLVGGRGADMLTGGLGNDTFAFQNLDQIGDVITDFSAATGNDDRFQITAAGFGGGLVAGALAAAQFRSRADNVAQDADDRFIFRTTDHTLWFDADGTGAGAAVMVADLQAGAALTAADFLLV